MHRWRPNYDGSRRRRTCATRPMRSCYRPSWRRCATVLPLGARLDPPVLPPPRAHSSHPLLLFNGEGDCLGAKLRPGNVHSAEDWAELLLPEIEHQKELGKEVVFRADAAFAKPEIYEALEERGVKYAIRIPANDSLERDIVELLTRPVGRPSHKPVVWYKGFLYQAASWKTARRVVAKVEFHFGDHTTPDSGRVMYTGAGGGAEKASAVICSPPRSTSTPSSFTHTTSPSSLWCKSGYLYEIIELESCRRRVSCVHRPRLSVPAGGVWI